MEVRLVNGGVRLSSLESLESRGIPGILWGEPGKSHKNTKGCVELTYVELDSVNISTHTLPVQPNMATPTRPGRQTAFAWAMYYNALNSGHTNALDRYRNIQEARVEATTLPPHFTTWVEELAKKAREEVECPICLTVMEENFKATTCGHIYCQGCFDRIDKCAVCRKKIYKPRAPAQ